MTKAREILCLIEQANGMPNTGTTGSNADTSANNGPSSTNGSTSSETSNGDEETSYKNGKKKHHHKHKKDKDDKSIRLHYATGGWFCDCDDPRGRRCLLYCKTKDK